MIGIYLIISDTVRHFYSPGPLPPPPPPGHAPGTNEVLHSIEIALKKRCAKFIHSCLNSNNLIIKSRPTSISALITYRSQIGNNCRYICYKYKIPRNSWFLVLFDQLVKYYSIFMISLFVYVCTSP